MDNLLAHHNQMVVQMIYAEGHRIMFRAPYWPVPIEYVFNTIEGALARQMYQINGLNDVTSLRTSWQLFDKCLTSSTILRTADIQTSNKDYLHIPTFVDYFFKLGH